MRDEIKFHTLFWMNMFRLWCFIKYFTEAVARGCSVKQLFLEIPQNSQENTLKETLVQVFSCDFIKSVTLAQVFDSEFGERSKNTFSYRAPPVVTSDFGCAVRVHPTRHETSWRHLIWVSSTMAHGIFKTSSCFRVK